MTLHNFQNEPQIATDTISWIACFIAILSITLSSFSTAQDTEQVARDLSNPVASLLSFPLQINYDKGMGFNHDGNRVTGNFQPVLPFSINKEWNLVSRTIIPIIWQDRVVPGTDNQFGLGDTLQSAFLSPAQPGESGWIYGLGPVFLIPTATDDTLGLNTWAAGPTAVFLKQANQLTYGGLFNHIWSIDDSVINTTFLQPFVSYTTQTATTYAINTESTYDWITHEWSIPLNVTISQVFVVNNQVFSLGGGLRYWIKSKEYGPEGFGARLTLTYIVSK